ncbi:PREDICTED: S-formylglutathione hydrolase [Ceratosolen solmsi marchali]|uniref:S-formylglutathione hydrolase n=1 Tax=Ceratosolen solmsi marchali TaxID=326594 RepID=A0AAJ7E1N1_9HYME|nr:PREDICTED: S-formylglutathione hydrolase [Ceratosolen solmsi marchali]XP_011504534.1 PREDICTED: S-formylglutathione hydrolase [Ceratosolen solmsi marchali]XP_011504536.1 PREDICTED: S-formylglutathione hydrolase [Ceratosolen solmsi marchali]
MGEITEVSSNKCFGGWQKIYSHESDVLKCKMNFGVYLPPQVEHDSIPVIYWLSGLTCTESNFITKAGAQNYAAEYGIMLVTPDTSPRGINIPGEDDSWDFGSGAGFYVNATEEPWSTNYKMFSYITDELPALINKKFPAIPDKQSIMGHSMGGHGALICALKYPGKYKSVSAFAPICNPINSNWGQKAFTGYLGGKKGDEHWKKWDATELIQVYNGPFLDILIHQGEKDSFIEELRTENLYEIAKNTPSINLILRLLPDYDHSYFFIATFIEEHIKHHVKYLKS